MGDLSDSAWEAKKNGVSQIAAESMVVLSASLNTYQFSARLCELSLIEMGTVSYPPLDVYKRQALRFSAKCGLHSLFCRGYVGYFNRYGGHGGLTSGRHPPKNRQPVDPAS